jgi:HK97 family phage major capsid protein
MASRLTITQTRLAEAEAALSTLEAQTSAFTAAESTATQAQVEAHVQAVREGRAAVAAAQREVTTAQALLDLERTAPAASSVRGPVSATPLVEQDPTRGYPSIGHFAMAARHYQGVISGRIGGGFAAVDERMRSVLAETERFLTSERETLAKYGATANPHQETQSEDGLNVPPEFRQQVWTPAYEADDLLPLFAPETTSSPVVQLVADETTPWGASGIHAYWVGEGKQLTASKLKTQPRQVQLHKVGCMVDCTDEILQDAPLLTARINQKAPQAIGWTVSEALVRGNGVAKPLGYEDSNYPGRVPITKETNQKPNTIYTENVLKMAARVIEGPGSRIRWMAHRSTIPQLATLKIGAEPSWTNQNQGLREAPNGMLLGFPIQFTQHAKALGTAGDLSLIDFAGYAAFVHSSGTRFDSSIHLYFDFDRTAFRWIMRVGGMPYLSTPLSPADGADTMSHFISLATRG